MAIKTPRGLALLSSHTRLLAIRDQTRTHMDKGGKYNFETPEELRTKADEYFAWCKANPIRGQRTSRKDDGEAVVTDVLFPRPFTFEGLALFLNIADWQQFANHNRKREGFADVFDYIRNTVRGNQIEGAMTGIYRENITARLNGITENVAIQDKPAINIKADEVE